jgi:hypothetical protein
LHREANNISEFTKGLKAISIYLLVKKAKFQHLTKFPLERGIGVKLPIVVYVILKYPFYPIVVARKFTSFWSKT